MSKEMLINSADREECRVALVDNGSLEELYIERSSFGSHVGNIYKGKVVNVEPSIQAVFIDFGIARNGFLHISDLHPKYFPKNKKNLNKEKIGKRKALKDRMPIQKCLRKGDEVVVQVTKEGVNTKGPTLSSYISLPGKYLVMMPWMEKQGVSHKIEDDEERERLKKILEESRLPKDMGFIVRTAACGVSKRDIQKDLKYLVRLWYSIEKRMKVDKAPTELYRESDLVIRTIRDVYNTTITKVICDSEVVLKRIRDFMSQAFPRQKGRVSLYEGTIPIFHKYKIEEEISKIQSGSVPLKAGGSIVIEQTEALVAIDVNSGKYRKQDSAEQTAYKINIEAAEEIARQLRLRDLGGLIICDFIDMRSAKHRSGVEQVFRQAAKNDRARTKILRISQFGVVEMTRQRMRPSLQTAMCQVCHHCNGTGYVKSKESLAIEFIRLLYLSVSKNNVKKIELYVCPDVAHYLQNNKRNTLMGIEAENSKEIIIYAKQDYSGEKHELICYDERNVVVKV